MPTLDDYLVAQCRRRRGRVPSADHTDFVTAFGNDPALLEQARARMAELAPHGTARDPSERDVERRDMYAALVEMIQITEDNA